MVRLIVFLVAVALAAYGLMWLAAHPGQVAMIWQGTEYDMSLMTAMGGVLALALAIALLWALIRFVFRIPSLVSLASRARRREKGFAALSRGMVAVGSGDARAARRHASEAHKFLGGEPLTKLLRAQSAQLAGDRPAAIAAFNEMLEDDKTHALGLRGLHVEARRSGDHDAALDYAARANKRAALPWAGQAVLDDLAAHGDWPGALAAVDTNISAGLIDRPTANRWRAVLKTAIAQDRAEREPQAALTLALEACRLAPGLVPAVTLAGRLTAANNDYRRAAKIVEAAWEKTPHPDLANVYLHLRHGDSALDRLARARSLARIAPRDSESAMTIARAALEAHDLKAARSALAPLIASDAATRPTARVCLLMADIAEEEGDAGLGREWLSRAARAPRDRAWVADTIVSDRWAPASPAGKLDAFVWRTPDERLSAPIEAPPPRPVEIAAPAPPPALEARPVEIIEPARPAPVDIAPAPPIANDVAPARANAPGPSPNLRVNGFDPLNPPDDPGPHEAQGRKSPYRFFSQG
jgi:HemY protein